MAPKSNPPYHVYAEQLASCGYGHAMWDPNPLMEVDENYKFDDSISWEVDIGDVGILTEGGFKRFFNVVHPENHPINKKGVPEDFEPLQFNRRVVDSRRNFLNPHPITSKNMRYHEGEAKAGGGVYVLVCSLDLATIFVLTGMWVL